MYVHIRLSDQFISNVIVIYFKTYSLSKATLTTPVEVTRTARFSSVEKLTIKILDIENKTIKS